MEKKKRKKGPNCVYTKHGRKEYQGRLVKVRGTRALGYFEGEKIVGYTTLEEITEQSYSQDLVDYQLDF